MTKPFLRRDAKNHSKFGKRRKKLLKWKRPTGRDNKMREKRKGYPKTVSIGYKKERKIRGTIKGEKFLVIKNIRELEKIDKKATIIIGAVGKKKKLEIAKKAKEKGIEIYNLNMKKLLRKNEKIIKKKEESLKNKTKNSKKEDTNKSENKK